MRPNDAVEAALTTALAAGLAWRLVCAGWKAEAGAVIAPLIIAAAAPSAASLHDAASGASPRLCGSDGRVLGCTMPGLIAGALAYSRLRTGESAGPLRAYLWGSSLSSALVLSGLPTASASTRTAIQLSVLLVAGLGTTVWLDAGECWTVAAVVVASSTLYSLALHGVSRCYTYGEASTVASLYAMLLVDAGLVTLCDDEAAGSGGVSAPSWPASLCLARPAESSAAQVAIAGVFLLSCVMGLAVRLCGEAPTGHPTCRATLLFYALFLGGCALILAWMGAVARLPPDPAVAAALGGCCVAAARAGTAVTWLIPFACGPHGRGLVAYWLLLVFIGSYSAWRIAPGRASQPETRDEARKPSPDSHDTAAVAHRPTPAAARGASPLGAAAAAACAPDIPPAVRHTARLLTSRKVYHALAVALLAPAAATHLPLLTLALAAVMGIFMLLETARVCRVPPLAGPVQRLCDRFVDSRDGGSLILTHQYLLAGCAVPLLLVPALLSSVVSCRQSVALAAHRPEQPRVSAVFAASTAGVCGGTAADPTLAGVGLMGELPPLQLAAPLAGVLVLGVGDAMAAAVGVSFGRRRWPGGAKTVEGSLAAVVSMLLALVALGWIIGWVAGFQEGAQLGLGPAWERGWAQGAQAACALVAGTGVAEEWLRVTACTIIVCLLEAFTLQIDNLFLPLAFLVALQVATPPPHN